MRIVGVHHEGDSISKYQLEDGRIIDREQAVMMADLGDIDGVSSFTTRDGSKAIRSDRGQVNYSLENLSEF